MGFCLLHFVEKTIALAEGQRMNKLKKSRFSIKTVNISVAHALRKTCFFLTVRFTGGASSSSETIICVLALIETI